MRALTLTQPWATLVAIGAKRIETRSWTTGYRGPIAIHAAKGWPRHVQRLPSTEPFQSALLAAGLVGPYSRHDGHQMPRGYLVAIARLAFVVSTDHMTADPRWELTVQERAFGDYSPGRYAWLLADVSRLVEPIECRGALGLWTVDPVIERRLADAEKVPA